MSFKEPLKRIRWAILFMACSVTAHGAITDLSTAPLVTSSTATVRPNLLWVLDDSGSMDWDYLPDWANDTYCRNANGSYTGACCRDSSNNGSSSNACWRGSPPFGTWRGHPPFMSADFNGVYYDPAVSYYPPFNADGLTRQPSQTTWTQVKNDAYGIQNTKTIDLTTQFPDTEWCTDGTYADCLRNDNYLLPGTVNGKSYTTFHATVATGSGYVATGSPNSPATAARTFGPHYYTINPGEYCDAPNLRNCQATQTATFGYPARIRWCSDTALTACQAVKTTVYKYPRYPTAYSTGGMAGTPAVPASVTFTLSLSGVCGKLNQVAIQKVMVNDINILSEATSLERNADKLAGELAAAAYSGGYTAKASGSTVTITAPVAAGNITHAVTLVKTANSSLLCTLSYGSPAFGGYQAAVEAVPGTYPGAFVRTDILPGHSYPKAPSRTDCAGNTCTYAEEMTNFANWWTYYHTRMQTTKTAGSNAFAGIGPNFRVGYLSINNNTGKDFLNLDTFDAGQKTAWYGKLANAKPDNSTPLRVALATAGRLYGGQLNGKSLNGGTVTDPVQYSCQQNFTILSTDGYWNEAATPPQLNGSTAVGNPDGTAGTGNPAVGTEPRPMLDGTDTADTLADVAEYYFVTDLRTSGCNAGVNGADLCDNNVPKGSLDTASWQHMTTFTLGLGASGYMQFLPDYQTAASGDFFAVKNGSLANPAGGVCSWQASGICNWPAPASNTQTTIDDLWHAAVNGRGSYFSAGDPASLATGLSNALNSVASRLGSSAAAMTSNPNVTAGDNFVFSSTFTTGSWEGELVRQALDPETGLVSAGHDWSARERLDPRNHASRGLYTYDEGSAGRLKPFAWDHLSTDEQAYFTLPAIATLSQFCASGNTCLSADSQIAASGQNLVNFLRGDRGNEGPATDAGKFYRQRGHVLGDIANAEAVYVKSSLYAYMDAGYSDFAAATGTRRAMVYAAANDGMLHAFDAETGEEAWAYVPGLVLPRLYKLADKNYAAQHRFFVDGSPTVGDICPNPPCTAGAWRTILVGGLNGGGRGYYALDITDPAAPKALWEFTDDNLGYSYGNPVITKLKNGTWVVLFASGYNNVSPGDGRGRLYVLKAATGEILREIATEAGDAETPNGLARINAWVDNTMEDNTALRVYGGDLLGNLWRFDINGDMGGHEAQLLATFRDASGHVQPITARPELGDVSGNAVVYVGTGRFLGGSDLTDTSRQSFYAVKDPLDATGYGDPRGDGRFIEQTVTAADCPPGTATTICGAGEKVRLSTSRAVNFATDNGWYFDLPDTGERANTDPFLVFGTLVFNTNIPKSNACTPDGYSYRYFVDYRTGGFVATAGNGVTADGTGVSGEKLGNALATRAVVVHLPSNAIVQLTRMSDGSTVTSNVPIGDSAGSTRRISWRQL